MNQQLYHKLCFIDRAIHAIVELDEGMTREQIKGLSALMADIYTDMEESK